MEGGLEQTQTNLFFELLGWTGGERSHANEVIYPLDVEQTRPLRSLTLLSLVLLARPTRTRRVCRPPSFEPCPCPCATVRPLPVVRPMPSSMLQRAIRRPSTSSADPTSSFTSVQAPAPPPHFYSPYLGASRPYAPSLRDVFCLLSFNDFFCLHKFRSVSVFCTSK
jgi:hypothetical protein